jgi:enoyl-CoA hydratase
MTHYDFTCASVSMADAVAEVTLAATGKGNRMGPDYWAQMPQLFARLDADDEVRAVVLRGAADNFSYGLDLMAMAARLAELTAPDARAAARKALLAAIREMQLAHTGAARCRKPVIAAVHGWCVGGGVDLITACDVRLCSRDAKFSVREVRMAMVADVGTLARLPALVGEGVARELALTGDDIDAARALAVGLVNQVHETPEALFAAARAMAGRIARNSPFVVAGIKEVMNASSERRAAQGLETVALWNAAFFPSEDLQEALAAFLEKREPRFTGR